MAEGREPMREDQGMKAERLTRITGGVLSAVLLLAPGCSLYETQNHWVSVSPGDNQGDVSLYRDVAFDDIPVPIEYSLLPQQSYSFQGASSRNGVFFYEGPLEWTRALEFYRIQMTQAGWSLEELERGFTFRILRFRKGPEQLLVTVRQMRNGSRAELQLDNIEQNDLLLKGRMDETRRF